MFMLIAGSDAVLGPIPGTDRRHEQAVEVVLGVGHGPASQHLAPPAHMACPVGELSDIEPYDGIAGGGFAQHGGILPVVGRSERCLARHLHCLAVALFGRRSPAVSY